MENPPTPDTTKILNAYKKTDEKRLKQDFLAQSYTPWKRAMDVFNGCAFVVFVSFAMLNLIRNLSVQYAWISIIAFVLAMFVSDFLSGLVHWGADTWGTFDTPIFGPTFIRSFREHHIAPKAMTKHDIFETNGDNCLLTLPVLYFMATKHVVFDGELSYLALFSLNFWTWVCLWVALTNQIHSWSHQNNPPLIARILQKTRLILPPEVHRLHHQLPFDRSYCITNGWCEGILVSLDFWRKTENFITKYTGMIPREDDMKWTGIDDNSPKAILNLKK